MLCGYYGVVNIIIDYIDISENQKAQLKEHKLRFLVSERDI